MKNSSEMVSCLLERRARYEAEKKQKRKILARTLTPICCVCLAALLGFGILQGGRPEKEPLQTAADALYPGIRDYFDVSAPQAGSSGEDPSALHADSRIVVNQITDGISADRMNLCLLVDDFVNMNQAELCEYYGIAVFPSVPDDLKEWDDQIFGIYRRNGGTGEVYCDQTIVNYSNEDFSRTLHVEMQKGTLPYFDYLFDVASEEKSMINQWEVYIGLTENGYYSASFLYHNVGFCVSAKGLTQDEFVDVLSSIMK